MRNRVTLRCYLPGLKTQYHMPEIATSSDSAILLMSLKMILIPWNLFIRVIVSFNKWVYNIARLFVESYPFCGGRYRVNLYHLRVFMTVAEYEHITRASEELYLSQPAVTKIVQSLEQEVGQKLVERQGRRIALTYAGQVLRTYARRMFSLEREMEEALAALSDIETGEVTLAANPITGVYLLPTIVARFRARYPCVKINLEIFKSRDIIDETLEWRLDFGLVEVDPSELPLGMEYETVAYDELILVVAPSHPWSEISALKARRS